jgi:hypothetical protein
LDFLFQAVRWELGVHFSFFRPSFPDFGSLVDLGVSVPSVVLGLLTFELLAVGLCRLSPLLLLVALDLSEGVLLGVLLINGGFPNALSSPCGLNVCHTRQFIGLHPSSKHAKHLASCG